MDLKPLDDEAVAPLSYSQLARKFGKSDALRNAAWIENQRTESERDKKISAVHLQRKYRKCCENGRQGHKPENKCEKSPARTKPIPPSGRAADANPYFISASIPSLHDALYRDIFDSILEKGLFFNSPSKRNQSPFKLRSPSEIRAQVDLCLRDTTGSHPELLKVIDKIWEYSPHNTHPYKVDRSAVGLDPYGLVGDWLCNALSTIVITFLAAPTFVLMEFEVWKKTRQMIGYPEGLGDGMTVSGAGMGNSYAIAAALQQRFKDFKSLGLNQAVRSEGGQGVAMFVSEHAAPYYEKYSIWNGVGTNGVIRIPVDSFGRMDVSRLVDEIKGVKSRGIIPFMIVATAGTPILGAIDPIDKLAQIAQEFQLHLHVDGNLAGANFFSNEQKKRLAGIEKSDSFLWSADRGLSAPCTTCILVTRRVRGLQETFGTGSNLVFGKTGPYDPKYDNGDGTLGCTRRPDILKIWLMWKAKGQKKLAQHVDHTYAITNHAVQQLEQRSRQFSSFSLLLSEFDFNQVAFHYIPSVLRKLSPEQREKILRLTNYAQLLKEKLLSSGSMTISVDTCPGQTTPFFVMRLANSILQPLDVNYLLDSIEYHGEDPNLLEILEKELATLQEENSNFDSPVRNPRLAKPQPPPPLEIYPDYVSSPVESLHKPFLHQTLQLLLEDAIYFDRKRQTTPAWLWTSPEKLQQVMDFTLSTDSEGVGLMHRIENDTNNVSDNGNEGKELMSTIKSVLKHSRRISHPYFKLHLGHTLDPYSLMADFIVPVTNSPMHRYEDSPIFTLMEEELIKALYKIVYPNTRVENYSSKGLILPGGSAAIQAGLLLATYRKLPQAVENGLAGSNKTLVAFVGAGHYATVKGASFGGLGAINVVTVEQDERGRMNNDKLRVEVKKAVEEGKVPFFICLTAGTTVLGSFDKNLGAIEVAREFDMWVHIDGSYGGPTILSYDQKLVNERLKGVENSDSFNVNFHKSLGSTRELSVFLTQRSMTLGQKSSSQIDLSIDHLFSGRRANGFKGWLMWKAKGREGLGAHIDYGYSLTHNVIEELKRRKESFHIHPQSLNPQSAQVCLYYVPKRLRRVNRTTSHFYEQVGTVQEKLIALLTLEGSVALMTKNDPGNYPPSIVISLYDSSLTIQDVMYIFDVMDFFGQDL